MESETPNHAAFDLEQYIRSSRELYPLHKNIWKNLATKRARGEYKHDLAVKAFGYLVDDGIKRYVKEFAISHPREMFDKATRKLVAEQLTENFEAEDRLGNYDYLLPKKYQFTAAHARKKSTGSMHDRMHAPGALRSASRRGLSLHARRAQLDREIARVVPSWPRERR